MQNIEATPYLEKSFERLINFCKTILLPKFLSKIYIEQSLY